MGPPRLPLSHAKPGGADDLVCDPQWVEARLRRDGPTAIDADFAYATSGLVARMRKALARSAHLLAAVTTSEFIPVRHLMAGES